MTRPKLTSFGKTLDQLVQMSAESLGLPRPKEASATEETKAAAEAFDDAVWDVLEKWVQKSRNLEEEVLHPGIDEGDLWDEKGPFLVYMTLAGHGIGIWDGSWDHFFTAGECPESLQDYLRQKLGSLVDDTGAGSFNESIMESAYETAS